MSSKSTTAAAVQMPERMRPGSSQAAAAAAATVEIPLRCKNNENALNFNHISTTFLIPLGQRKKSTLEITGYSKLRTHYLDTLDYWIKRVKFRWKFVGRAGVPQYI